MIETRDLAEQLQPPASSHGRSSSSRDGRAGRIRPYEENSEEIAAKMAAKKVKHRVHCQGYRAREKAKRIQIQEENKNMKSEQENLISRMKSLENDTQNLRKTADGLKEILMRPIPLNLEINGERFRNLNELSDWLTSQTYDQKYQGVVDSASGAASSCPDNGDYDNWIHELLNTDPAQNPMLPRFDLSPALRSTENIRDQQHIRELNLEIERPRNVEATKHLEIAPQIGELQDQLRNVGEIISQLAEESKGMSNTEPYLARKIQDTYSIVDQHVQNVLHESFDNVSHPVMYSEEYAKNFMEKLEANEKSAVDYKDFCGLEEELETSGRLGLPQSLVPVDELLKKHYGDITAESNQSPPVVRASYILFCSVIKEMGQLQLEQLDLSKMIVWRDAINSGLSIGFKGRFAIQHLKRIAGAYFDSISKARCGQELKSVEERISKLMAQLYELEKRRENIAEMHYGIHEFQGKPLSTGLFL